MVNSITVSASGGKGKYDSSVEVHAEDTQGDIRIDTRWDSNDTQSVYLSVTEARQLARVLLQLTEDE